MSPATGDGAAETKYSVGRLLLTGFLFHLVFIGSVFNCYFTSPVVHGMESFRLKRAEAKRLVLIVGDGLRADLLFNENPFPNINGSPKIVAPYLRSIVETRGAFGISHTRVPTESRPGHVAIIGGMYEDVSAVTKGWKTNPVDFDSVFNQSSTTFSFGSPDILPMFARGAVPGRVLEWSYSPEEEDFTKDAVDLDKWVLNQVETLLRNATTDPVLDAKLRSGKVVFFLHLLGLDTTGHSYRPHSPEYMRNIQVVDEIVERTEELMREFYKDNETSYVFTADHGMSVIGNHGDGHPDCTRTPLIAWGKGIRGPMPDTTPSSHDAYSAPWGLSHLYRRDVEQADIAALMSTLIGASWPVNSVGVLPDVDPDRPGYLAPRFGERTLAEAAGVNARMILEQYRTKHELKRMHTLFYHPYPPLETGSPPRRIQKLEHIRSLLNASKWYDARLASRTLIQDALDGLHYLQTYDRTLLRTIVTLGYLGWMLYASLYVIRPLNKPTSAHAHGLFGAVPIITAIVLWVVFYIQNSPWSYYLYVSFPAYFWSQVLRHSLPHLSTLSIRTRILGGLKDNVVHITMVLGALLGLAAGYTHRTVWSFGALAMANSWLFQKNGRASLYHSAPRSLVLWYILCAICAVFPLVPVDRRENVYFIAVGGAAFTIVAGYASPFVLEEVEKEFGKGVRGKHERRLFVQRLPIIAITITTVYSSLRLQSKLGLPLPVRVLNWILLVIPSLLPYTNTLPHHTTSSKLLMYLLSFGPCFVILSISVEGLFFVTYSAALLGWVISEKITKYPNIVDPALREKAKADGKMEKIANGGTIAGTIAGYVFDANDMRLALTFLFFVHLGFFGIGNVASISSFYLEPVYRLIPIFSPFSMSTLLLFKLLAPYVMLSTIFAHLNHALRLPPFSILLVSMCISDVMTLMFFYRVRDTGSWLQIGESITFFVMSSLLFLFSAGMSALGEWLMQNTAETQFERCVMLLERPIERMRMAH
ncbi:PigN-domain-containing protein [Macrolepiota fuliginosa MF-IS2]|uniref:GPI ethanolamine phosphate transferase 1 n=1 Tax=Macrolepiota fuliginosa MF-IS2 TaxID=1400762 RepID=A0A9P5X7Y5_9AGAR|nr:PigN-domain-containing protein [Macrolepiota fuliginosa MF-IS2]